MKTEIPFLLLSLGVFLFLLPTATYGHFLSIEDLEHFYDFETELAKSFKSYLEEQRSILNLLKQRYEIHKQAHAVLADPDHFVSNPLNVHALLKRLASDWPLTLALLGGTKPIKEGMLPRREEYIAAVHAITRLQQVYNLSTSDLASGTAFPHTAPSSIFTAADCISIAQYYYKSHYYTEAVDWLKEALKRSATESKDGQNPTISEQLLEYLALATCLKGDQKESDEFFQQLYNTYPSFYPSQDLTDDHISAMNQKCKDLAKIKEEKQRITSVLPKITRAADKQLRALSDSLCRNEGRRNLLLRCYLIDYGEPDLMIRPVRIEEFNYDPPVVLFHNIIQPNEIEQLVNSIHEKMNDSKSNGLITYWYKQLHQISNQSTELTKRLADVYPLFLNTTKNVRFSSYTVGGEDVLHHDGFFKEDEEHLVGENMASMLITLHAPEAGGDVVFPNLRLVVTPPPGSALVWHNLNEEDNFDPRAAYGTCPVLLGHRRVLTVLLDKGPNIED